jgi:hypothetical protein
VTLVASPQTGQTAIVLDKTGNAAANAITITPAAGNIDGSANVVINTAYGWWMGFYDGAKWKTVARQPLVATSQATPSNPTGTTSTTGVMTGLAGSITPTVTGRVLVTISGDVFNATAIADGAKVQLRTGTGTAPTNGAALAGTACGGNLNYVASTTAGKVPFSVTCVVTGLTLGTAVWLDLGLAAITGGTATIENVGISAHEI